jgi:protein-tyrosine-phosphatase
LAGLSDVASALSRPGAVLFACNFNRVRSPMAEALLKRLARDRIYVDSCGQKMAPGEEPAAVDPFVEAVMAELACDLSAHTPKTFDDLEDDSFDLVVSLTPEAQHRAVELTRGRAAEIEYWPTFDPTLVDGSRESRLAAYREVRDGLAARITERFGLVAAPAGLDPPG